MLRAAHRSSCARIGVYFSLTRQIMSIPLEVEKDNGEQTSEARPGRSLYDVFGPDFTLLVARDADRADRDSHVFSFLLPRGQTPARTAGPSLPQRSRPV